MSRRPHPARPLTAAERAIARDLFGLSLDPDRVQLHHAAWWPLQPPDTVMAPDGDLWFHPRGSAWREDYGIASPALQGLFVHELTHAWQAQHGGRWFLPLVRHPLCRYRYRLAPGKPFRRYGIEQQAEIVRHAFVHRRTGRPCAELEALLRGAGLNGRQAPA